MTPKKVTGRNVTLNYSVEITVELSLDSIPLLAPSRIDYSKEDPK